MSRRNLLSYIAAPVIAGALTFASPQYALSNSWDQVCEIKEDTSEMSVDEILNCFDEAENNFYPSKTLPWERDGKLLGVYNLWDFDGDMNSDMITFYRFLPGGKERLNEGYSTGIFRENPSAIFFNFRFPEIWNTNLVDVFLIRNSHSGDYHRKDFVSGEEL